MQSIGVATQPFSTTAPIAGTQIPIRNIWLLMLYASDVFPDMAARNVGMENNPDEIPDMVAELLCHVVERRLRRNLSSGYAFRRAVLGRVRGSVDLLRTTTHQLLERGVVACRFEDLTANTPRNRYAKAALESMARLVRPAMAHRCRKLAGALVRLGVWGERPTRSEISTDRCGRHDAEDQRMIAVSRLAFDLCIPDEDSGRHRLFHPFREITWLRRLFEKAIGGFYGVVLSPRDWRVETQKSIHWQIDQQTDGIGAILPSMRQDIVLEHLNESRRIVIDTKFNAILTRGWHREESIRSGYLYQIYAYLRSQERDDDTPSLGATGILLHPAVGDCVDEAFKLQGHIVRFTTIDLSASAAQLRADLLGLVSPSVIR